MYYTHDDRQKAIDRIDELIDKIAAINDKDFCLRDVADVTKYLGHLREEIVREEQRAREVP